MEEAGAEEATEEPEEAAAAAAATDAEVVYSRSELAKMSRAEVREISVTLGLAPRKSSAAMVNEILESQGWPDEGEGEEVVVAAVEDEEETTAVTEVEMVFAAPSSTELVQALDQFPDRLYGVLDQFLTDLGKTIEGVIFNGTTPEEPEQAQLQQPTRRLTRTR